MNELVTRVAENVGLEPATAEKAVGMILGFLQREAADGPVAQMIASIPGATDLIAQYNGEGKGGGGLLGGLMSAIGGGGVMALGQQLMSQGLGMGEITSLAKETIAFAKEKAGADVVDEVVASVPASASSSDPFRMHLKTTHRCSRRWVFCCLFVLDSTHPSEPRSSRRIIASIWRPVSLASVWWNGCPFARLGTRTSKESDLISASEAR